MSIAILLVAVCGLLAGAPDCVGASLAYDRDALLGGEAWRLWSAHWVHFSAAHAATDLIVLFLVASLAERELGTLTTGSVLLVGAPLVSAGLLLWVPDLQVYAGSSALSSLLACAGGVVIWTREPRVRPLLAGACLLCLARIWLDANDGAAAWSVLPQGVHVAWQAHVVGALLGGMFGGMFGACRRLNENTL